MRILANSSVITVTNYLITKRTYAHNHLRLSNSSFKNLFRYQPPFLGNIYYGLNRNCTFFKKKALESKTEKDKSKSETSVSPPRPGIIKLIFGRLTDEIEAEKLSLILYENMDTIEFKKFYSFFDMPDTFNSWFQIIELHMWMFLTQLMDNERKHLILRNAMIKLMWFDVENRLCNLGVSNFSKLKKQLKELNEAFPITLWVYDDGLFNNDVVLASAIWYKFFNKNCDDPRKIEVLVRYIRHQIHYLGVLNLKNLESAKKIERMWVPLTTHIKAVKEID